MKFDIFGMIWYNKSLYIKFNCLLSEKLPDTPRNHPHLSKKYPYKNVKITIICQKISWIVTKIYWISRNSVTRCLKNGLIKPKIEFVCINELPPRYPWRKKNLTYWKIYAIIKRFDKRNFACFLPEIYQICQKLLFTFPEMPFTLPKLPASLSENRKKLWLKITKNDGIP